MAQSKKISVWRRVGRVAVITLSVLATVAVAFEYWRTHRSQPAPAREQLFKGVDYERLVRVLPRPIVAHVVRIDFSEPGVDFFVTPPEPSPKGDVRSRTTSTFLEQHGMQLAINANYFYPFRNDHPLSYEPHPGDPVHVVGTTASRGVRYGKPFAGEATIYISRDRQISFDEPRGAVWNAVSGLCYVLQDGVRAKLVEDAFTRIPYPRTIVATDAAARTLLLLVVDGKQPGYSEGVTLAEAADLLLELGAFTAVQLDGGGSSTLVRADASGGAHVVNTPANFKVPGWERSIATQLGVKARAVAEP
jgi:hypothetical protein